MMKNGRNAAMIATIAAALSAPLAIAPYAARADELSDLRANQQLLQERVDQLAQSQNVGSGSYMAPTGGGPTTVQMMGGSFPRSFLIPGTDTSIRVGGEIRVNTLYWITGGPPHSAPQGTNAGATGQLAAIPLSNSGPVAAQGRSIYQTSPQQSKLNFETRTPTAWGEARTFIEFDFTGVQDSTRTLAISDNLVPRMRYAYGTLGGFLAGQANSNFSDPDANMEAIDFSGLVGSPGVSRIPQLRYTMPLAGWWNLPGALSFSAESPEPEWWSPATGTVGSNPSPSVSGNPVMHPAPDLTMAWYIPQPWGHVDFSAVLRPALRINDGMFVDQTFMGYGGHFSGDVKPGWFGWAKDDINWNVTAGNGIGRYIGAASANDTIGLVSNYTTALASSALTAGNIIIKPVTSIGGTVGYLHQWTPTLRSNVGLGVYQEDINSLNGAVCSVNATAARAAGTAGCGLNKRLVNAIGNLFYNPLPFVDIGLEYMYGHRITVANQKGDENVVESRFRVRF
jgi:hypothetical protein